jgi:transposase
LRDQRELLRTRMALRDLRTSLKHRIHAGIDRYGLQADAISDLFGAKGRACLAAILKQLPPATSKMTAMQLGSIDQLEEKIEIIERGIAEKLKTTPEMRLLRTVPGLGQILAPLVWLEIGDVERFPRAEHLASYAGLVPRIIASGGHIRHGGTCRNVNHYLKWAFVEAANCAIRLKAHRDQHIARSTSDSIPTRATDVLSLPSPATWPRLLTGCCERNKATAPLSRALPADTQIRPSSGKRETRLVSTQASG